VPFCKDVGVTMRHCKRQLFAPGIKLRRVVLGWVEQNQALRPNYARHVTLVTFGLINISVRLRLLFNLALRHFSYSCSSF